MTTPATSFPYVGQYIDWVIALSTLGLLIATGVLAWVTYELKVEAKRTREAQSEPDVWVTIEQSRYFQFFELVIENIGGGVARDVQIASTPSLKPRAGERPIDYSSLYSIKVLKPGSAIRTLVGRFDEIETKKTKWTVSFRANDNRNFSNEYEIDLTIFDPITRLGDDPANEVADSMKKIADHLKNIASGWSKIKADVYTSADRKADREEMKALREHLDEQKRRESEGKAESDGR